MATARRDKEWFRCAGCGHKLCRMVGTWSDMQAMPAIEVKCHSCGTLNYIMIGRQNSDNGREGTK